ncbi:FkbM family methyltransferase [Legionella sp. WA2022007384]
MLENASSWKTDLTENQIYLGYTFDDLKRLEKYQAHSELEKGFYTDYFGIKTDLSFFSLNNTHHEQSIGRLPFPCDTLHAEALEYIGAVKAIEAAKNRFVGIELGAGYGPWLVFAAKIAQQNGINDITLVGVEADIERLALMRAHFIKNGLPISEPDNIKTENQINTRCIYGGISESKEPLFYGASGIADWGGAVSNDSSAMDYRGQELSKSQIPSYTIEDILDDFNYVDYVHMDIQGSEFKSLRHSIGSINKKVRFMLIATHSRKIEGEVLELFIQNKWTLLHEKPCKFDFNPKLSNLTGMTTLDGIQVWFNENLYEDMTVY